MINQILPERIIDKELTGSLDGGSTGQILRKLSADDLDYGWVDGYSKQEIDNKFATKSNTYTKSQTDNKLAEYEKLPTIESVTLASVSWVGTASPYSQTVTLVSASTNSKVDIIPDPDLYTQMYEDGTNAICITNDNGTFTAYAIGEKPTADLLVDCRIYEVAL